MASHPHVTALSDVEELVLGPPPLGGARRRIGAAVGLRATGCSHLRLGPGERPFPVHLHLDEEETAFVLRGSGRLWRDGATHELAAGDAISHLPGAAAHAYLGGPDGMELVVFSGPTPSGLTYLPRLGLTASRGRPLDGGAPVREREAALGALELPPASPRPPSVVALADVPATRYDEPAGYEGEERDLGAALEVVAVGLRHTRLDPGALSCPPHWHTAEDELFLVLDGGGTAWLGEERLPVGPGSVVGRPAGTGVAHALEAGPSGLAYLGFGTRSSADHCVYPRSGKVEVGGLVFRPEVLGYWDGETR